MSIQLYPGIAFSPQAALADNIGAADTIIKVTDASAFPDAPNLATIGTDEEGETILYAAKTADALSGCVRGVEGAAKPWSVGELIGRNFTAKDHHDLIAAVLAAQGAAEGAQGAADAAQTAAETAQTAAGAASQALAAHESDPTAHGALFSAKQDKLSGAAGQVVGFSSDGSAAAVPGWSNPNLLHDWYFVDPINQRGQTEYTGTYVYSIDRWKIADIRYKVSSHTVTTLTLNPEVGRKFFQPVEVREPDSKKVYTFSAIVGGKLYSVTANDTITSQTLMPFGRLILWSSFNGVKNIEINFDSSPENESIEITAAKLELGSQQTLACQDADGNWVLNDPPPNKTLELLKCQRYYRRDGIGLIGLVQRSIMLFTFPFPVKMRTNATPSLLADNIQFFDDVDMREYTLSDMEIKGWFVPPDGVQFISISGTFSIAPNNPMLRANMTVPFIALDADL